MAIRWEGQVFDFLLLPENLPFSVALLVMLMIGAAEAVGLGAGAAHVDADIDGHIGFDLLGWLGVGRGAAADRAGRAARLLRDDRHRRAEAGGVVPRRAALALARVAR